MRRRPKSNMEYQAKLGLLGSIGGHAIKWKPNAEPVAGAFPAKRVDSVIDCLPQMDSPVS